MYAIRMNVTTDASGDGSTTIPFEHFATATDGGPGVMPLLLYAVEWIDGTFEDGVGAVLSATATPSGVDSTLLTLTAANSDAWYYARVLESDNTGTATAFYSLPVVNGDLKLVVATGGNTKTGGCIVYLLDA